MDAKTTTAFETWLSLAQPGDRYTYLTRTDSASEEFKVENPKTGETEIIVKKKPEAAAAWKAHGRGLVELVQRRVDYFGLKSDGGFFDYIAIRRKSK